MVETNTSLVTVQKQIHVQVWTGGPNARVTEMANAHKRGKVCRIARFGGWVPNGSSDEHDAIRQASWAAVRYLESLDGSESFDDVVAQLRAIGVEHGSPAQFTVHDDETIRGVDAPRETLTAGIDGKWHGSVSERGIVLDDETDQNNLPCMITPSGQKNSQAYQLAAKVWPQVRQAKSMSEAGRILGEAGCKLHYFCRMD